MTPVRLVVIGAGRRVAEFYAPVLAELAARGVFTVVGVASRTSASAQRVAQATGWRAIASIDAAIAEPGAEAALVALPPEPKEPLARRLLDRGGHLFLESPVAPGPRAAAALAAHARRAARVVEVAEEQAFGPEAELERAIVRSGVLGPLVAVVNDGREYYHHASARLHQLVGELLPAAYSGRDRTLADGARLEQREMRLADGTWFHHRFAVPKSHPVRFVAGWQVVCERGAIGEASAHWRGADGDTVARSFEVQGSDPRPGPAGRLTALAAEVDGRRFDWRAACPVEAWNRQHHGLARLLIGFAAAVRGSGAPLHGVGRAAADLHVTAALALAARVPLPVVPAWAADALARLRR